MDIDVYQNRAIRTANGGKGNDALLCCSLGIAGEAGEVVDLVKKWVYHGHAQDVTKMREELGDVLWYVAVLAASQGLSLDEIARYNLSKLSMRYPGGFSETASWGRGRV